MRHKKNKHMKTRITFFAILICNIVCAQSTIFISIENQIKDHIAKGRWDEIIMLAPDLLIEDPTKGDGYFYTALAFLKMGIPEKATEYIALAEPVADSILKTRIADLKADISSSKQAIAIVDKAGQQEKSGNNKMAADEWKKLWELDKSKTENALNAVELYVGEKKYLLALEILNDAALSKDADAKNLSAKINQTPEMKVINGYNDAMKQGKAGFEKGSYQTALSKFEVALSFKSNDADAVQFKKKAQDEIAWEKAKSTNTSSTAQAIFTLTVRHSKTS